jgi:hypothetical protein
VWPKSQIVSDRKKGGQIIKLAGSAQTQESTPIDRRGVPLHKENS